VAELKPAADQRPSVYKTTIQNVKPTAVLEHLLEDAGPWSLECDSHDIRLVDKYIDKKAVKTPELSPDIWSEVRKNNSLRAKASGIHSSMQAMGKVFCALMAVVQADDDTRAREITKHYSLIHFRFRMDRILWQWKGLPFGYKNSMQIMARIMAPVIAKLEEMGIAVLN